MFYSPKIQDWSSFFHERECLRRDEIALKRIDRFFHREYKADRFMRAFVNRNEKVGTLNYLSKIRVLPFISQSSSDKYILERLEILLDYLLNGKIYDQQTRWTYSLLFIFNDDEYEYEYDLNSDWSAGYWPLPSVSEFKEKLKKQIKKINKELSQRYFVKNFREKLLRFIAICYSKLAIISNTNNMNDEYSTVFNLRAKTILFNHLINENVIKKRTYRKTGCIYC